MTDTIAIPADSSTNTAGRATASAATYYPWFDWLRAVCAIAVMLYHENLIPWTHSGRFAVEVFFALSGWLIGGILLKLEPAKMPRFYFNRAIRIWAPYYLAVALVLSLSLARDHITFKWVEIVVYELTFVFNIFGWPQVVTHLAEMPLGGTQNQVWSVNAEEQFYLLAPLLLVYGDRKAGRSVTMWAALAALSFFTSYTSIVLGVFMAVVVHHRDTKEITRPERMIAALVLGLAALGMAGGLNAYRLAPVAAICIVLIMAVPGKQHRFGELWGGMSYPLYLNHWIGSFAANFVVGRAHRETPTKWILSIVLNLLLAMAMYWWIDRQLIARRDQFYTVERGRVVMRVAYGMIAVGSLFGLAMAFVGKA